MKNVTHIVGPKSSPTEVVIEIAMTIEDYQEFEDVAVRSRGEGITDAMNEAIRLYVTTTREGHERS